MAMSALLGTGQIIQKPCHDLESVFYVMIYVFTMYKGPGVKQTNIELNAIVPSIFNLWFTHNNFILLAYSKHGCMGDFKKVIKDFTPYLSNLGALMTELHAVMFQKGSAFHCIATHDKMLNMLCPAFGQLSDNDASTHKLQPETQRRL